MVIRLILMVASVVWIAGCGDDAVVETAPASDAGGTTTGFAPTDATAFDTTAPDTTLPDVAEPDSADPVADTTPDEPDPGPVDAGGEDVADVPSDTGTPDAAEPDAGPVEPDVADVAVDTGPPEPVEPWIAFTRLFKDEIALYKPESGVVTIGTCGSPKGIVFVPPDAVFVACGGSDSIEKVTLSGQQSTLYASDSPVFNPADVTLGPGGDLLFSTTYALESSVWRISPAGGEPTGYAKLGEQENFSLIYHDKTVYWADVIGGGKVLALPDDGTVSTLIDDIPSGFDLRDMALSSDGKLHIVGANDEGGLRIYDIAGSFNSEHDLPENGYGIALDETDRIHLLVGTTKSEAGLWRLDGEEWVHLLADEVKFGTLALVTPPFTQP